MKSKIYTEKEIKQLEQNPFVICVERNRFIKYDSLFKLWCILQRKLYPEKSCKEIFSEAGFDVSIMNPKLPQARIKSWEDTFYRFDYEYFISNDRYCKLKDELLNTRINSLNDSCKLRLSVYSDVITYIGEHYGRHASKN